MEDYRARLEKDFAKTLQDLSEELTPSDIRKLTNLYPKISNKEAYKIRKDDDPADCFLRKIKGWELCETNVDGLIKNLEHVQLEKPAGILKRYKSRNTDLINKEIERLEHEKQPVAISASSSTAKSPPSQKGDRTEKQPVAISASSSTAKSPPSQKGDRTDVKNKLFISFSSKNEEMVKELVRRIESVVGHGSCWMYTYENLPGDNLPQNIVNAINEADTMLCMITQDYIDSKPCSKEFYLAYSSDKHIIPLHLEKVQVPYKQTNGGNSFTQLDATPLVYARMYIDNPEPEFQKVIAKIKECLHEKDANASGRPSTSGSQKRKSSHDGDDSEAKVPRKE